MSIGFENIDTWQDLSLFLYVWHEGHGWDQFFLDFWLIMDNDFVANSKNELLMDLFSGTEPHNMIVLNSHAKIFWLVI